jgi:hypothetical protein
VTEGQETVAFYQVSVDGRTARELQIYPEKRLNPTWRGFDVHPNGRTVAMQVQGEEGSEIWAMENVGLREASSK